METNKILKIKEIYEEFLKSLEGFIEKRINVIKVAKFLEENQD